MLFPEWPWICAPGPCGHWHRPSAFSVLSAWSAGVGAGIGTFIQPHNPALILDDRSLGDALGASPRRKGDGFEVPGFDKLSQLRFAKRYESRLNVFGPKNLFRIFRWHCEVPPALSALFRGLLPASKRVGGII